MRGEKQGDNECLLATIADLTNTPLRRVRETALAFSGKKTWTEVANVSLGQVDSLWWKTVFYLCDIFDTSKKLAYALVQASATNRTLDAACVAATRLSPDLNDLPLNGKGVIVLANYYNPVNGHIVPWEDGFAFDTNVAYNFFGESLEAVKDRYWDFSGYSVQGISQL